MYRYSQGRCQHARFGPINKPDMFLGDIVLQRTKSSVLQLLVLTNTMKYQRSLLRVVSSQTLAHMILILMKVNSVTNIDAEQTQSPHTCPALVAPNGSGAKKLMKGASHHPYDHRQHRMQPGDFCLFYNLRKLHLYPAQPAVAAVQGMRIIIYSSMIFQTFNFVRLSLQRLSFQACGSSSAFSMTFSTFNLVRLSLQWLLCRACGSLVELLGRQANG